MFYSSLFDRKVNSLFTRKVEMKKFFLVCILLFGLILSDATEINKISFFSFDKAIPISCTFSEENKFVFSTFLNPPMITQELFLPNNSTTYFTQNDNSFFSSSSNGRGIFSVVALYPGEDGISSIHINSIFNSTKQLFYFVINSQNLAMCDYSPLAVSEKGNTYYFVSDRMKGVSSLYKNSNIVVKFQGNRECYSIFSMGEKVILLSRGKWGLIYNEKTGESKEISLSPLLALCYSSDFFVYGEKAVILFFVDTTGGKRVELVSDGECCLSACSILKSGEKHYIFLSKSNGGGNTLFVYSFTSPPIFPVYPIFKERVSTNDKFPNVITEMSSVNGGNNKIFLGIATAGGGESNLWSKYPQINLFSFDAGEKSLSLFYSEITLGSAISVSSRKNESGIYFSFCGEYNNELVPTNGGYISIYFLR